MMMNPPRRRKLKTRKQRGFADYHLSLNCHNCSVSTLVLEEGGGFLKCSFKEESHTHITYFVIKLSTIATRIVQNCWMQIHLERTPLSYCGWETSRAPRKFRHLERECEQSVSIRSNASHI